MITNPLAARFTDNGTALVNPEHAASIEQSLRVAWDGFRAGCDRRSLEYTADSGEDDDGFWCEGYSWVRPYNVVGGVLQIPVKGVLLSGFPYQLWDWATGYEYIQAAFERGMDDPEVKGIAFVIDSPGGQVTGNFDLVDLMSGERKTKPVQAFAESAYSAAYSIASAADKITVTRTGGVGSIGVVTSHCDMSEALAQRGYKITFIFAGKHKVDGNPYEALADDVKARIQATVDKLYGMFVGIVARNRGMTEEAVRATEALTYISDDAVQIGLADAIGPLVDSLAAFSAEVNTQGGTLMSTKTETQAETPAVDTAAIAAEAHAKGATEASARIKTILTAPEAANKSASAMQMAFETTMTAEQAIGLLKTIPETKAETKAETNAFEAAMNESQNPQVGSGTEAGATKVSPSAQILADYAAHGGQTRKRV